MLNEILLTFGVLAGIAFLGALAFSFLIRAFDGTTKVDAERELLNAQADHVTQQASAELLLREQTIAAYEKQGVSKFKTELARLGLGVRELEAKIGSKIKGFSVEEHEKELAISRKIILDLQSTIDGFAKANMSDVATSVPQKADGPVTAGGAEPAAIG